MYPYIAASRITFCPPLDAPVHPFVLLTGHPPGTRHRRCPTHPLGKQFCHRLKGETPQAPATALHTALLRPVRMRRGHLVMFCLQICCQLW